LREFAALTEKVLADLSSLGIDLDQVTAKLEDEGG